MEQYPKRISYDGPRNMGSFFPAIHDLLQQVMIGLRMTHLDENVLQVEYPADLVQQIRLVDVDDTIFRLDFVLTGHPENRFCFFPHTHWGRKNFFKNGRFNNCRREETNGRLLVICPKLEDKDEGTKS